LRRCGDSGAGENITQQAKRSGEYEGPPHKTKALLSHLQELRREKRLKGGSERPQALCFLVDVYLDLIEIALKTL